MVFTIGTSIQQAWEHTNKNKQKQTKTNKNKNKQTKTNKNKQKQTNKKKRAFHKPRSIFWRGMER